MYNFLHTQSAKSFEWTDLMCKSEHQQGLRQRRSVPEIPSSGSVYPTAEGVPDLLRNPRPGPDGSRLSPSLSPEAPSPDPLSTFVKESLVEARTALDEFERIMTLVAQDPSIRPEIIIRDPRVAQVKAVLEEAVAVLEKTKHAFKSKDLGVLRRRLKRCIADLEEGPRNGADLGFPIILFDSPGHDSSHRTTRKG